jgi:hypothetical protein
MMIAGFCGCCRHVSFPVAPAVVEAALNRALRWRVEARVGPWLADTTRPAPFTADVVAEKRENPVGEVGAPRRPFTRGREQFVFRAIAVANMTNHSSR